MIAATMSYGQLYEAVRTLEHTADTSTRSRVVRDLYVREMDNRVREAAWLTRTGASTASAARVIDGVLNDVLEPTELAVSMARNL